VAQANLLASRAALAPLTSLDARAFNVGTGLETSVNQLAAVLGEAAGRAPEVHRAPARLGEIQRSALDPGKAARDLGWRPGHTLAAGVRATFAWFRDGAR